MADNGEPSKLVARGSDMFRSALSRDWFGSMWGMEPRREKLEAKINIESMQDFKPEAMECRDERQEWRCWWKRSCRGRLTQLSLTIIHFLKVKRGKLARVHNWFRVVERKRQIWRLRGLDTWKLREWLCRGQTEERKDIGADWVGKKDVSYGFESTLSCWLGIWGTDQEAFWNVRWKPGREIGEEM